MKIGMIAQGIYPYNFGGHEIRINQVGKRLAKNHELHLYLPNRKEIKYPEEFEGIKIHPIQTFIKNPHLLTSLTALEFAKKVPKKIEDEELDIVDILFYSMPFEKKEKKTVATTGAFYESFKHRSLLRKAITFPIIYLQIFLNQIKINFSDKVISISEISAREMEKKFGVSEDNLEIIKNGVSKRFKPDLDVKDLKSKLGFEEEDFIITYSGRLAREKGVPDLIKAVSFLDNSQIKILLLGDGEIKDEIKNLSKKLNVKTQFAGTVKHSDIPKYLNLSDLFVLPSYWEIQPLSCIEAMACGVPVISTEVGGIPEVVKDEKNGLLVKPGEPKNLAEAIERIRDDEELRDKLRKEGLEFAKERTWDKIVNQMEQTYQSLVNQKR